MAELKDIFKTKHTYSARHIPSGEKWFVLAVNRSHGYCMIGGWPTTIAKISNMENWELRREISEDEEQHAERFFGFDID